MSAIIAANLRCSNLRRLLLFILCIIAIGGRAESANVPNVLVILADDLGFSDVGCYGGEIETPNLNALAASGLRFTQFHNTARCWPTRGSLLTGYYAQQIGRDALPTVSGGANGKRPRWAQLLPRMLKPLGYRSYLSGKWHVDGKPIEEGFDHSYSDVDGSRYFHQLQHTQDDKRLPPTKPETGPYLTVAIADHAIECLKEHAEKFPKQPFFHYLAFTSPHFPLHAPATDIAKYRQRYDAGWDVARQARWARLEQMEFMKGQLRELESEIGPPYPFPEAIEQLGPGEVNRELEWSQLTAEQKSFQSAKMAVHAAMVDRMDQEIGRVVAQLKAMNAFEDTLILFLSDNGASAEMMIRGDGHRAEAELGSWETYLCLGPGWSSAANTPFRRHKTWVHEGGIATPLIAHWPSGIKEHGGLRRGAGHVIDIAPTIVELAGGTWPTEIDGLPIPAPPGRSFANILVADADAEAMPRSLWWLHEGNRAFREGDWKAVAAKGDEWELYDLAEDQTETNNLAKSHPGKLAALVAGWERMTEEFTELRKADKKEAGGKRQQLK